VWGGGAGVVICLELGADLHMAQLMPLPLTLSCFIKIQIGFAFLVPAHPGSPGKGPLNGRVCGSLLLSTGVEELTQTEHRSFLDESTPVVNEECIRRVIFPGLISNVSFLWCLDTLVG